MILLLLILFQDNYHFVPLSKVDTTPFVHICTLGLVTYVRKQKDGDIHITLTNETSKIVLEIISEIPLLHPKKGQYIEACGIARIDKFHKWAEIHPVLRWKLYDH